MFRAMGRKLKNDVAATERELQYTSEVLGLKYDKPAGSRYAEPQVETATRSKRSGGYCVVIMCHIRHGLPDVAYADKTLQRRISKSGSGVRCRMQRNRLIRPTGCSTSQQFSE
ncbi:hypothetical protein ACNKHN_12985 [Shigella flexneri]